MTFAEWYATHVEPTIPHDMPKAAREPARALFALCWNAAIDAADAELFSDPAVVRADRMRGLKVLQNDI
jgi:hypothetical protein